RSLPQKIDNFPAPAGETATRTTECFAKCARYNVDFAHHAPIFMRAASGFAEETSGVRIVDHRARRVFFGKFNDPSQVRDRPAHRETAVGRDQSKARVFGRA